MELLRHFAFYATHGDVVKTFKRYHDGINRDDYIIDRKIPSYLCVIA